MNERRTWNDLSDDEQKELIMLAAKEELYGQFEFEAVSYGATVENNAFEMHVKDAIDDAFDRIVALFEGKDE